MKTHKREILIYYNPESASDRRTVAHAQSMSTHVRSYSYGKSPSTSTSWIQILHSLDVPPKELLNKAHPYYQQHIRGREFSDEDWIKVIQNNPELLKSPIAVRGKKAIVCRTPTDIYRLTDEPGTIAAWSFYFKDTKNRTFRAGKNEDSSFCTALPFSYFWNLNFKKF